MTEPASLWHSFRASQPEGTEATAAFQVELLFKGKRSPWCVAQLSTEKFKRCTCTDIDEMKQGVYREKTHRENAPDRRLRK